MRAVVTAASAHDPGRAGDIVKYGTSLCTPAALARFEELSACERATALHHLDAWGNKLLSGDVKRVRALGPLSPPATRTARRSLTQLRLLPQRSWDHMMPPNERSRAKARERGKRFRERRALKVCLLSSCFPLDTRPSASRVADFRPARQATADVTPTGQPPPHRLILPSQPRDRFPTPPHDFRGRSAAMPHAQLDYAPRQASRTYPRRDPRHDYLHDPAIFCPSCDPFDEAPSFVPPPPPPVYHPAPREQGTVAPHVLHRPFGEGEGHEHRRYGER